jgi:hypothetical protein
MTSPREPQRPQMRSPGAWPRPVVAMRCAVASSTSSRRGRGLSQSVDHRSRSLMHFATPVPPRRHTVNGVFPRGNRVLPVERSTLARQRAASLGRIGPWQGSEEPSAVGSTTRGGCRRGKPRLHALAGCCSCRAGRCTCRQACRGAASAAFCVFAWAVLDGRRARGCRPVGTGRAWRVAAIAPDLPRCLLPSNAACRDPLARRLLSARASDLCGSRHRPPAHA